LSHDLRGEPGPIPRESNLPEGGRVHGEIQDLPGSLLLKIKRWTLREISMFEALSIGVESPTFPVGHDPTTGAKRKVSADDQGIELRRLRDHVAASLSG
jgi:hypothetical protein